MFVGQNQHYKKKQLLEYVELCHVCVLIRELVGEIMRLVTV